MTDVGGVIYEHLTQPIFPAEDVPSHVVSIPELDFTADLVARRLAGPWFRLAAWTVARATRGNVHEVIQRQSILLPTDHFSEIFDDLDSIGNVLDSLGASGYTVVQQGGGPKTYSYSPFYRFEIPFTSVTAEPLVFFRGTTSGPDLLVNPDLWLLLGLEERTPGCGIWWDDRYGVEALRRRNIDNGALAIVEIRVEHLVKYLRARELSLVIGHYRHLHYFNPPQSAIDAFVSGELTLGSPDADAKALLQNWGLRRDLPGEPFLQRRLHLWYRITPPALDIDDPLSNNPPFDIYDFTLPMERGPVAPGRWSSRYPRDDEREFAGVDADFMDPVYFRQEVLTKYESADGFSVGDDGSVSCRDYWSLARSTSRLGNELISSMVGDFAEGVPFDEWLHWKQYAVEPPSADAAASISAEQTIPEAVNGVAAELERLNRAFRALAHSLGATDASVPWQGSLDSLAGRQLKWNYSSSAGEDEFLKRATLASTFVIDALEPKPLRQLALAVGTALHLTHDDPPRPLASRKLLERITLVASIIEQFRPDIRTIEELVAEAEGMTRVSAADLRDELRDLKQRLHDEFRPLAFLYDLRTFGGLAHQPNLPKARIAAAALGLPERNWHRADYLRLLNLVRQSVRQTATRLSAARRAVRTD